MRIAIFIEENYDEKEFWYSYFRMQEAGYEVVVIGSGRQLSFNGKYGIPVIPEVNASEVNSDEFNAVIIPGGFAPDKMRINRDMLRLVKEFMDKGKIVAAICHGGWVLSSANVIKGKAVTACESIKDDLINAGANFIDQEVVVDGNLITSRRPSDLPAFCRTIIQGVK